MSIDVTTLARVKTAGDFNAAASGNDALINQLISAMSERFRQYLDQEFLVELRTQIYDVYPSGFKFLSNEAPLHLVTEVVNDADQDFDNTTALLTTDYLIKNKSGQVIINGIGLIPGYQALRVKYLAGLACKPGDFISQLNTPPVAPTTNDAHLIGAAPTGAWASNTTDLTTWNGSAWTFQTQQARFLELRPNLASAADTQINFEIQRKSRLGTNYTAIRSHVRTFNAGNFLPEVEATLNVYARTLFTDDN